MKQFNKTFFTLILLLLSITAVHAKGKIPIGNIEQLEIVAELPRTEDFQADPGQYLNLARLHTEFTIAKLLPLWVTEEPQLVLAANSSSQSYYTLTEEQLNQILTSQKLNKEELLKLDFYTRYGGKGILLLIIAVIIFISLSKGGDDEETEKA